MKAELHGEQSRNGKEASWTIRCPSRSLTVAALVCWLCLLSGCGQIDPDAVAPLRTQMIFGSTGLALGQFNYPRTLAIDHENEFIYIIDRTARIQRYGFDGKPQMMWRMPEWELGMPTGVTVCPKGRVLVADTHYYRVIIYDSEGSELMRFGEYGTGPGQFIYPTRVAVGPQDRLYVAETGGNDRVQVFDPGGQYLFEFGSFGSEPGQFSRPQAMVFNPERSELYIADACNHRIAIFDPDGNFLRQFGTPGRGFGELAYPYDVMLLSDGSIIVCEYHNARIQKFDADGQPRGLYGRLGRGKGELQYPWSVAGDDETLFVLDSGNNRVQVARTP